MLNKWDYYGVSSQCIVVCNGLGFFPVFVILNGITVSTFQRNTGETPRENELNLTIAPIAPGLAKYSW